VGEKKKKRKRALEDMNLKVRMDIATVKKVFVKQGGKRQV